MSALPLAPEFSGALQWINAPASTLRQQRGRVVLVAFWHAGSAWSHNLLDDLRLLQARHSESLGVFAIHTPKFEAERDPKRVQKAVNRHQLRFPVAHDPEFTAWQHFGIRSWPAVAVIDTRGHLVEIRGGDLQREALEALVLRLIEEAGFDLQRHDPVSAVLRPEPRMPLLFPSGLAVSPNHLYVSDTGHHRVLECNFEGRVLRQFGSGSPGLLDGGGTDCSLQSPRGLTVLKDMLYICDTGNHALRRVRLLDGDVDTIAGTGRAGQPSGPMSGGAAELPLNAPWDVTGGFDRLFLAMAGMQQVWEFDLGKRSMRPLAGSGRLALVDGGPAIAAMAQPAGLALVQQTLYVADSGGSAIRSVNLGSGNVQTLVGHGAFEFGDQDGTRSAARMQYPLALALDPRSPLLWIADTYNDRLKMLRLGGGDLRRFETDYRLHEPGAIAASPGVLWLANTGAHEIVRIDLDTGVARRLPIGE
jgi:hypothetical protein